MIFAEDHTGRALTREPEKRGYYIGPELNWICLLKTFLHQEKHCEASNLTVMSFVLLRPRPVSRK